MTQIIIVEHQNQEEPDEPDDRSTVLTSSSPSSKSVPATFATTAGEHQKMEEGRGKRTLNNYNGADDISGDKELHGRKMLGKESGLSSEKKSDLPAGGTKRAAEEELLKPLAVHLPPEAGGAPSKVEDAQSVLQNVKLDTVRFAVSSGGGDMAERRKVCPPISVPDVNGDICDLSKFLVPMPPMTWYYFYNFQLISGEQAIAIAELPSHLRGQNKLELELPHSSRYGIPVEEAFPDAEMPAVAAVRAAMRREYYSILEFLWSSVSFRLC